jgi:hypothetical protein
MKKVKNRRKDIAYSVPALDENTARPLLPFGSAGNCLHFEK